VVAPLQWIWGLTARQARRAPDAVWRTVRQNSRTKGTSLGCWLAPEMTPVARHCGAWAVRWVQAGLPKANVGPV